MLDDLNETLKRLLVKHLKADGPVDVSFEQPTREWSAKINRPTVNFFLLKLLENRKLRELNWDMRPGGDNRTERLWHPKRVDVYYMVTAWATEPADEYHLLWRALAILLRATPLPREFFVGQMATQDRPITIEAAQTEILENPAEIWSALNNEFKPSISLKVTLEMDLELIDEIPLVLTKRVLFADSGKLIPGEEIIQIGGFVFDSKGEPLPEVQVKVVEREMSVASDKLGRFTFLDVPAGEYTLEATAPDGSVKQRRVNLGMDRSYDFTL